MTNMVSVNAEFGNIQYRQNYLKEVIVRLDFLNAQNEISEKLPSAITEMVKEHFPIAEPKDVIGKHFQISQDEFHTKDLRAKEWHFHSKDREKTLVIGAGAIFIKYSIYHSFEELKREFLSILNVCFDVLPNIQGKRIGLRYINSLDIPGKKPLLWDNYINTQMLGLINFAPEQQYIARVFHILEYNYGDFNMRFQYGIPNPDFPANIKQRNFVLDFDAYYQGIQERGDISKNLDMFHLKIQQLFEQSITDELRNKMNE